MISPAFHSAECSKIMELSWLLLFRESKEALGNAEGVMSRPLAVNHTDGSSDA